MHISKKPWSYLVFPLLFHFSLYPRPIDINLERKVLQNFEEEYKIEKIISKGNLEVFPEVSVSGLLTSPELISEKSLLIRYTEESRYQPLEYIFNNPILLQDFVTRLEFHVYSSSNAGEIYFLVQDSFQETHKILSTRINFSGWKKIDVSLLKINQNDLFFNENRKMKFLGFLFIPPLKSESGREFLIAIDDIISYSLPKYKSIP